jgi:hypothetical protein
VRDGGRRSSGQGAAGSDSRRWRSLASYASQCQQAEGRPPQGAGQRSMWFGRSRKIGSRSEVQPIPARERMTTPGEEYAVGRHRERERERERENPVFL